MAPPGRLRMRSAPLGPPRPRRLRRTPTGTALRELRCNTHRPGAAASPPPCAAGPLPQPLSGRPGP
eukprot:15118065-Alexandrium_andersonii.AAC.1